MSVSRPVLVVPRSMCLGSDALRLAARRGRAVVDEPIAGVDAPVFYFRWADGSGFGVHRDLFKSADWRTIAGETALEIDLDGITVNAVRYD